MSKSTPMLRQYQEIKRQHPGTLLFFRLGDFYEMFFDDAVIGSKELEITLTARNREHGTPIPMCGVPYHAASGHIAKLVRKGYRVAICEQTEDPKTTTKLVRREVVRIVTPGTAIDAQLLEARENNYLASVFGAGHGMGVAFLDLSTGEFVATEFNGDSAWDQVLEQLDCFGPREIIFPKSLEPLFKSAKKSVEPVAAVTADSEVGAGFTVSGQEPSLNPLDEWLFSLEHARELMLSHFDVVSLDGFGLSRREMAVSAAGAALNYVRETQKEEAAHITGISYFEPNDYLILDTPTVRNLELTESLDGTRSRTLLGVLDETVTGMGSRLLKQWLLRPSMKLGELNARLDAVDELKTALILRDRLRAELKKVSDLERLMARISMGRATPRDLISLKNSADSIPGIKELLADATSSLLEILTEHLDELADLRDLIGGSLDDDPPAALADGGYIRAGYNSELDELRELATSNKSFIAQIESRERTRTGISTLKVKFNNVFGYFIEVSKSNVKHVPADYERRQTLTNAERYTTPELKEYEAKVLGAEERITELEQQLFSTIRQAVAVETKRVQAVAQALATLDVLLSLAEVAARRNYCRPMLTEEDEIYIKMGRHPVIEATGERFIPNDAYLNNSTDRLVILTGANMGGKCVSGSTLVFTDRGLIPISELMPPRAQLDRFSPISIGVKTLDGPGVASHYYRGGLKQTVRLRTKLGYSLEGTPEHRVWVRSIDGNEGWKSLANLTTNDHIAIDRNLDLWGEGIEINYDRKTLKRARDYPLPDQLNTDLAYLMGLLVGDGSRLERNGFALTTRDEFIQDEFCRIMRKQFGYEVRDCSGIMRYRVTSKLVRDFLAHLGLGYEHSYSKTVPAPILRAPRVIVRAFLQGLFDTDGHAAAHYGKVSLSTSSRQLAEVIHLILLNFGIVSSLRPKKTPRRDNFIIDISGEDSIRFYQQVGFRLLRKQARETLTTGLRMPNKGGIPHLDSALCQLQKRIVQTKDKPVALKRVRSVSNIFYTYLPNGRNLFHSKLEELANYCHLNGIECDEFKQIQSRDYFYDRVEVIEKSEAEVFDLSVPGTHSYIANGMVSHNSTYLRQIALISILAQIGSFVPADESRLAIVDRIFTRVGASDNLARGRSTFMVEMTETANILNTATPRSLVLLDEVGRGTATFDGLSLAWAIAEYLHDNPQHAGKTLFATHYHEMTELAKLLPGVRNYQMAIKESEGAIIFLRRVSEGSASKSYGIEVARLAGLPHSVIERAREILTNLEANELDVTGKPKLARHLPSRKNKQQPTLFQVANEVVVDELRNLDLADLSPEQAIEALRKLKEKVV